MAEYRQDAKSGKNHNDSNKYRKRYYILWSWLFGYFPLRYIALLFADSKILSVGTEITLVVVYVLLVLVATGVILDKLNKE